MCKKCYTTDLLLVNILVYLDRYHERSAQENEEARQEFVYEIQQELGDTPNIVQDSKVAA